MYSELLSATRPTRTLARADPQTYVEGGGTVDQPGIFRDTEPSRQDLDDWFNVWAGGGPTGALVDKRALMIFGVGSEWISDDDLTAPHPRTGEPVTPDEYLEFVWPQRQRDEWFIRTAQTCYWAGFAIWEPIPTEGGALVPNREPFHGFEYVHPPTIDAFWDNHGNIREWVQTVRSRQHTAGRLRAELDADDILHITLNPKGRHPMGLSLIDRAWDEIQTFQQNKRSTAEALQRFAYLGGQVKVGREDGPAIDDNELRRVRQRYRRAEGAKWLVTGTDIEMEPFDSGTIGDGINAIRDRDIQDLATALDVPLEWTNYAGDGLGTGKPADSRLQAFESSGQSEQRRMAMHAVEWAKRLLAESPFPDEVHIDLRFEDILTDQAAIAEAYRDLRSAYTKNEMREKMGDGPVPEDADIDGEEPVKEEAGGEGEGGFGGLMWGPDTGNPIRALAEVPDNAVSIDDPSEAPEGASIVKGPRGGTYYVPGGADGGGAEVDLEDVERGEEYVVDATIEIDGEQVDISDEAVEVQEVDPSFGMLVEHPEHGRQTIPVEAINGITDPDAEPEAEGGGASDSVEGLDLNDTINEQGTILSDEQKEQVADRLTEAHGEAGEQALDFSNSWRQNSISGAAETLAKGLKEVGGLDGDVRDSGREAPDPTDEQLDAIDDMRSMSQDFFEEKFDGETELVRGTRRNGRDDFLESFFAGEDSIDINANAVDNYTSEDELARAYTGDDGLLLRPTVSSEDVQLANASLFAEGFEDAGDEYLIDSPDEIDISDAEIRVGGQDIRVSRDPNDMEADEVRAVANAIENPGEETQAAIDDWVGQFEGEL